MGQVQHRRRDLLREVRPSPGIDSETGRRWLDARQGRFHLRELRPGAAGKTEIRILFIFDPQRRAILLGAGDKARHWTGWYRDVIKLAEDRYARFLATPPGEIR